MDRRNLIKIGVIGAVVIIALYFLYPPGESINLGLDLKGGSRLVLQAKIPEDAPPQEKDDMVNRIITILTNRVNQYGLANPVITKMGQERILVKLPGTKDPEVARQLIGRTAMLEFKKVVKAGDSPQDQVEPESFKQEVLENRTGVPFIVQKRPLLTGKALADARVQIRSASSGSIQNPNRIFIALTFNNEGAKRFVQVLTQDLEVDDRLAIVLDDVIHSAPRITQSIKDAAQGGWRQIKSSTTITGQYTPDEARRLSIVLRAGALPAEVEIIQENSVGPTLGQDSIRRGIITIATGFLLILLYMPIRYRWLGLVADLALVLNMIIIFGSLAAFGAALTLPGIAGVILTIGITVDANVIIFERIKEERRSGKPPVASITGGFKKSLSAVLDANITTLAAAFILLFFGTGPVRGFAITLGIGIVGSLFCALFVTRFILEVTPLSERLPVAGESARAH